jgi:mono/diheme cytochrome c family protein
MGAHLERKTRAPPTLEGEGARVQPSWLVAFLRRPQTLRPWLAIRMPDYGLGEDEARAFAAYFAALAGVPASDEAAAPAAAELTAQGLRRFAHYKCMQCHPAHAGAELPAGVDHEDLSINLGLARSRLRPSWMRAFLASPKTIVGMQTRMPGVFYSADGAPKVERPTEDIEAITAFLLHASEPPDAAVARLAAERKAAAEQPATDWTTVQY